MRNYEMFTNAGNKACDGLVKRTERKINGKQRVTQEEITDYLQEGIKKIADKHGEIYDSEPPYHIAWRVNKALEEAGYSFKVDSYDICF